MRGRTLRVHSAIRDSYEKSRVSGGSREIFYRAVRYITHSSLHSIVVDVAFVLLGIAVILFFGFFAEFIFRKFRIPDVLFLIILGFVIGPYVLRYVEPSHLIGLAPIFTTFALIILLFDGAFNIGLSAFVKEFGPSVKLTLFNFTISTSIVALVMVFAGFSLLASLLTGFILGGTCSAFVIPILKQLNVKQRIYSLLTFESALTDILSIVFSLTIIELTKLGTFQIQIVIAKIITLFAVAGFLGIIAGAIWIAIVKKVLKEHNYMITIAYLLLLYVVAEYLGGNGAIAALTFGIIIRNAKQIEKLIRKVTHQENTSSSTVTTHSEEYFYHQLSFLLKTFFFVYVGVLIDLSNHKALILGAILGIAILFSRRASILILGKGTDEEQNLINVVFARGLAAAAIAQLAIQANITGADFIAKITYIVITTTIILSSISIFVTQRKNNLVSSKTVRKNGMNENKYLKNSQKTS